MAALVETLPRVEEASSQEMEDVNHSKGLPRVSVLRMIWRFLVVNSVLFWFGLVRVADWVGLRWLFFALTGQRKQYERLTAPIALRRAFEVLGPTYVKLGQLVASGEALFPESYSEEFRKLLDRVPPFSLEAVNRTLDEELGDAREKIVRLDSTLLPKKSPNTRRACELTRSAATFSPRNL